MRINQKQLYIETIEKILNKKSSSIRENYLKMKNYNENKMYRQIIQERLLPYKIDIEPTTRCFLNCRYCQVPYWERNALPDLTLDVFKRIVDDMPYLLEMKLQGQGEPLLNNDLFEMIRYATLKDIIVRFNTNGMIMDERKCYEILDSGLFELRVSLDGATQTTNEFMRPGVDFHRIVNNVERLVRIRGENTKPLINVWMLLTKYNIHELCDMIDLCTKMGVDGLKIQTKLSTRDDENIEKKVLMDTLNVNTDEFSDRIREAYIIAEKKGLDLEIITSKWRSKANPCWWLSNSAYISSDGYVVPCSIVNNPDAMNFGNVMQTKFYDIWVSDEYSEFKTKTLEMEIDELCKWCYICKKDEE